MTSNNLPISLVGVGANTAVGLTADSSAAAVRAGISGFAEHPELVDREGEPLIVARSPFVEEDLRGIERFIQLALPAAQEALTPLAGLTARRCPIPLVIGLPATRPGLPELLADRVAERMKELGAESWTISDVQTFSMGHSAGLMALEAGRQKIQSGAVEFCLIGGIDSYMEKKTLGWLEKCDQIHGAGPHKNAWGFIPGEAAGFGLLCRAETAQRYELTMQSQVLSVSIAREKSLIKTDAVCLGHGLTEAFNRALRALPSPAAKVDQVICDMNGEAYRADEYGFAIARTSQHFVAAGDFLAPGDCWGDVGAASGPLFLTIASVAGRKGYAKGRHSLLWTSSEGGERAAALIHVHCQMKGD
jgi:3-oxoacyl-[acyl-carrier-protein] synthase I